MMEKFSILEALETAIETEKLGIEFYGKLADIVKDPELKKFFQWLRGEEARHLVKYTNLKKEYEKRERAVDMGEEAQALLRALSEAEIFKPTGWDFERVKNMELKEAVKKALDFEKHSLLFFYSLWDSVEKEHADILREIILEERNHVTKLSEVLGKL